MTGEKAKKVLRIYQAKLNSLGVKAIDFDHRCPPSTREKALGHCFGMIPKMLEFIDEGSMDKAFRWLGFIQGVLWCHSVFTLEDLKNHNRPQEDLVPELNRIYPSSEPQIQYAGNDNRVEANEETRKAQMLIDHARAELESRAPRIRIG